MCARPSSQDSKLAAHTQLKVGQVFQPVHIFGVRVVQLEDVQHKLPSEGV